MVVSLITHFFRLTLRNEYFSKLGILIDIISVNITLLIYYYTSKTFGHAAASSLAPYKTNFFEFIVFGEILLTLPLFFLEGTFRKVKQAMVEGVWQTFSLLPIPPVKAVVFLCFSALPKELLRIGMLLLCSFIFFDLKIDLKFFVLVSFATLITIPIFFSLGLLLSGALIKLGRGQALLGYVITLLSVSAGAFFPIAVLPDFIVMLSKYSPYTVLLETSRLYYADAQIEVLYHYLWLLPWLALIPVNMILFTKIVRWKGKDLDSVIVRV